MAAACGGQASRADETPQRVVVWRAIGSWSGRGNRQTESFTSDTGALRVRWTTNREAPAGAFRLTAHSAISGRLLEQVVDHRGAGSGVGYVNQDPHVFYLMVESDRLDWTFSVEEGIAGTVTGEPRP
jgi:opacity protein-like surface antigen